MSTIADVLVRVASIGGYCTLAPIGGPGPWRPLEELVAPPSALARRVVRVRAELAGRAGTPVADVDLRAVASTVHLGLAARLVSPVLATTLLGDLVPDVSGGRWRWRAPEGGEPSIGLAVDAPAGRRVHGVAGRAEALRELLLVPVLMPLEQSVRDGCGVSPRVLRGNLASALAGAVTALVAAEPGLGPAAREVVEHVLRGPELTGHGRYDVQGAFRRNSCCLYYRLPGARQSLCGDCVLATP